MGKFKEIVRMRVAVSGTCMVQKILFLISYPVIIPFHSTTFQSFPTISWIFRCGTAAIIYGCVLKWNKFWIENEFKLFGTKNVLSDVVILIQVIFCGPKGNDCWEQNQDSQIDSDYSGLDPRLL